jgi:hypothetical protein
MSYIDRRAIPDLEYGFSQFLNETVIEFQEGAEDCQAFMVEFQESCVDPIESMVFLEKVLRDKYP